MPKVHCFWHFAFGIWHSRLHSSTTCLVLAETRDVHPPASDHHPLDASDGRDIAERIVAEHDEIRLSPTTQGAQVVAAIEETGRSAGRGGKPLEPAKPPLDEPLPP